MPGRLQTCSGWGSAEIWGAWGWIGGRETWPMSGFRWWRWRPRSEASAIRAQGDYSAWTGHEPKPYWGETPWEEVLKDFPDLDVMAVATPDQPAHRGDLSRAEERDARDYGEADVPFHR